MYLHPQLHSKKYLKHLLSIQGLPQDILMRILSLANYYIDNNLPTVEILKGKTVSNLFFENSTRTRSAFELAAQKLGANILSLNIATSSSSKGESLCDTVSTIISMQTDILVMRHFDSGAPFSLLQTVQKAHIINAGDGQHEHPTQALLDMCTIGRLKNNNFSNLKVAIVGDILHSRVARSDIFALSTLGCCDIRLIAPKSLLPYAIEELGVKVYADMKQGLKDVDVIIMLRLQNERMQSGFIPNLKEYFNLYGLDEDKLSYAKQDVIIMHPGPMNRGVEISDEAADSKFSVILNQVHNGIGVRMATMHTLIEDEINFNKNI